MVPLSEAVIAYGRLRDYVVGFPSPTAVSLPSAWLESLETAQKLRLLSPWPIHPRFCPPWGVQVRADPTLHDEARVMYEDGSSSCVPLT
jgi:hypothetical protein